MLRPSFFRVPPTLRVQPGFQFQVTGYAQAHNYTLVMWRLGDGLEFVTGETLYRGDRHIATAGGQISLYAPPSPAPDYSATPRNRVSAWDRVDRRVGLHGVPMSVATALRAPKNTVYFSK